MNIINEKGKKILIWDEFNSLDLIKLNFPSTHPHIKHFWMY